MFWLRCSLSSVSLTSKGKLSIDFWISFSFSMVVFEFEADWKKNGLISESIHDTNRKTDVSHSSGVFVNRNEKKKILKKFQGGWLSICGGAPKINQRVHLYLSKATVSNLEMMQWLSQRNAFLLEWRHLTDMHLFCFVEMEERQRAKRNAHAKQWWDEQTVYLVNGGRLHGEWQTTSPKIDRPFLSTRTYARIFPKRRTMKLSWIFHGNNRKYLISASDSIFIYFPESRQAADLHMSWRRWDDLALVKANDIGSNGDNLSQIIKCDAFCIWLPLMSYPDIAVHHRTSNNNITLRRAVECLYVSWSIHSLFVCASVCLVVYVTFTHSHHCATVRSAFYAFGHHPFVVVASSLRMHIPMENGVGQWMEKLNAFFACYTFVIL